MRLFERTLADVRIARRDTEKDALGHIRERFDIDGAAYARASILPLTNALGEHAKGLENTPYGVRKTGVKRLLLPADAPIDEGDGVLFPGDTAVCWVCVRVDRWSMHKEARLERSR